MIDLCGPLGRLFFCGVGGLENRHPDHQTIRLQADASVGFNHRMNAPTIIDLGKL
jgi:hypothetical protein